MDHSHPLPPEPTKDDRRDPRLTRPSVRASERPPVAHFFCSRLIPAQEQQETKARLPPSRPPSVDHRTVALQVAHTEAHRSHLVPCHFFHPLARLACSRQSTPILHPPGFSPDCCTLFARAKRQGSRWGRTILARQKRRVARRLSSHLAYATRFAAFAHLLSLVCHLWADSTTVHHEGGIDA